MNSKIRRAISAAIMTIAFLFAQPVSTARSAALLQFEEVGGDVVGSLSGSLNVTGLPQASCICTFTAFVRPALGFCNYKRFLRPRAPISCNWAEFSRSRDDSGSSELNDSITRGPGRI